MNEQAFYQTINEKSKALHLNPLLLLSGIEGLYTFRDVRLNAINYEFLDSLILTILALRIGDKFHTLAQEQLSSTDMNVQIAAINELTELNAADIAASNNPYLQSFAQLINGKSPVRRYHEKALEAAALEVKKAQVAFGNERISMIILAICKDDPEDKLGLAAIFSS